MLHVSLLNGQSIYAAAYSNFLMLENVSTSLEDDIHRLEEHEQLNEQLDNEQTEVRFISIFIRY